MSKYHIELLFEIVSYSLNLKAWFYKLRFSESRSRRRTLFCLSLPNMSITFDPFLEYSMFLLNSIIIEVRNDIFREIYFDSSTIIFISRLYSLSIVQNCLRKQIRRSFISQEYNFIEIRAQQSNAVSQF